MASLDSLTEVAAFGELWGLPFALVAGKLPTITSHTQVPRAGSRPCCPRERKGHRNGTPRLPTRRPIQVSDRVAILAHAARRPGTQPVTLLRRHGGPTIAESSPARPEYRGWRIDEARHLLMERTGCLIRPRERAPSRTTGAPVQLVIIIHFVGISLNLTSTWDQAKTPCRWRLYNESYDRVARNTNVREAIENIPENTRRKRWACTRSTQPPGLVKLKRPRWSQASSNWVSSSGRRMGNDHLGRAAGP